MDRFLRLTQMEETKHYFELLYDALTACHVQLPMSRLAWIHLDWITALPSQPLTGLSRSMGDC